MALMFRTLARRLRAHWRGEQNLRQAFGENLLPVALPTGVAVVATFTVRLMTESAGHTKTDFLFDFGLLLSILAAGWWCKGMLAMSMTMLSRGALCRAFAVFCIACSASCWVATGWAVEWIQYAHADWRKYKNSVAPAEPSWTQHALDVLPIPELHRFVLSGDMGWGSADALERALTAHPEIHLLELESSGGLVYEKNKLVALVQRHRLDTLVRGMCYSACTSVFLAGERRFVGPDAKLGFHQSGYAGRPKNTTWDSPEYELAIFYRERGISDAFMHQALNTSYYNLWLPDALSAKRAGFATQWWSDRPKEYD